jgi:methionine-rich copper-binding protein CopC
MNVNYYTLLRFAGSPNGNNKQILSHICSRISLTMHSYIFIELRKYTQKRAFSADQQIKKSDYNVKWIIVSADTSRCEWLR